MTSRDNRHRGRRDSRSSRPHATFSQSVVPSGTSAYRDRSPADIDHSERGSTRPRDIPAGEVIPSRAIYHHDSNLGHQNEYELSQAPPGRRNRAWEASITPMVDLNADGRTHEPTSSPQRSMVVYTNISQAPPSIPMMPTNSIDHCLTDLSPHGKAFAQIRFNGFAPCRRFVEDYAFIIEEDSALFHGAASLAYAYQHYEAADCCLQRWLILRKCQEAGWSPGNLIEYIRMLENNQGNECILHRSEFKLAYEAMKACSTPHSPSEHTQSAMVRSFPPPDVNMRMPDQSDNLPHTIGNPAFPQPRTGSHLEDMGRNSHYEYAQDQTRSLPMRIPSQASPIMGGMPHRSMRDNSLGDTNERSLMDIPAANAQDWTIESGREAPRNNSFQPGRGNMHHMMRGPPLSETQFDDISDGLSEAPRNSHLAWRDGPDPSAFEPVIPDFRQQNTVENEGFVRQDGRNFFRIGRVFQVMWHTPAGHDRKGRRNHDRKENLSRGPAQYGQPYIYTKSMYMLVVIRKNGYSICCPISTYGGQGVLKEGLRQIRAHAVIFSQGCLPRMLDGEDRLIGKDPIPVDMVSDQQSLRPTSRVHFGQFHTVHWNIPVVNVGMVNATKRDTVRSYFLSELTGDHSTPNRRERG